VLEKSWRAVAQLGPLRKPALLALALRGLSRKFKPVGLTDAFSPVVDLVFPPRCPLCGEATAAQLGLCGACWSQLAIPGEPSCALCSRPFGSGTSLGEEAVCAPCLADPPRHDGIAAATLYNDASRKLVLAFKRGRRIALSRMMARLMAAKLGAVDSEWIIVPVPLHRWRLWQRGYNQAALLAGDVARQRGARLVVDGLYRRKATPTLGGLGSKARARALSGAIAVNPKRAAALKERSVVLIDDVLTSGATSNACVSALKRTGARKVVIACFARVLHEALDLA
jgi:ComF family protein